jgi:hypothetical protein
MDVIGTKVLRVFYSHLYKWILPPLPSPLRKRGLKLVCNVNIVSGNLHLRAFKIMPGKLNEIVCS